MWQSIVKKLMRYNRNMDVRRKVVLFFEADKLNDITLACKKLGYKRSYTGRKELLITCKRITA